MMPKSFSFPGSLGPWVNPKGKSVPPPHQSGGFSMGTSPHMNVPAASHGFLNPNQSLQYNDLHVEDIHLKDFGQLKEILQDLQTKVEILMEAITLAHQVGPDGKCLEDCWSCKVQETMRGIKVARKLGAPEKKA